MSKKGVPHDAPAHLLALILGLGLAATAAAQLVAVDQLGYRPGDPKVAWCTGSAPAATFELLSATDDRVVWQGAVGGPAWDENSAQTLRSLDFSAWRGTGQFVVRVGAARSAPFVIASAPYGELADAALRMLTFQRCGEPRDEAWAADFAHAACHLDAVEVYGSTATFSAPGGWHDAGDYGRYVVPGAVAVGHLLLAAELWPDAAPALKAEARYELEWLLRMQDAAGGAYHKVTSRNFPGLDVAPDFDFSTQVASPVSYTATADLGAVLAWASRLYTEDAAFARACREGARRAGAWVASHRFLPFRNPEGLTTGEYGDGNGSDEALWLAVELRRAGIDKRGPLDSAVQRVALDATAFGWADTGLFGVVGLLLDPATVPATRAVAQRRFAETLADLQGRAATSADRSMMRPGDFRWGSNLTLLEQAMVVLVGHRLDASVDVAPALENLHALLGRNALGQCFVTGFGTKPVVFPHHRPSVAAGTFAPVPGMVAGGPNAGLEDSVAQALRGSPAALCYLDDASSYSTNEVAIYWNTPLVFVLTALR